MAHEQIRPQCHATIYYPSAPGLYALRVTLYHTSVLTNRSKPAHTMLPPATAEPYPSPRSAGALASLTVGLRAASRRSGHALARESPPRLPLADSGRGADTDRGAGP